MSAYILAIMLWNDILCLSLYYCICLINFLFNHLFWRYFVHQKLKNISKLSISMTQFRGSILLFDPTGPHMETFAFSTKNGHQHIWFQAQKSLFAKLNMSWYDGISHRHKEKGGSGGRSFEEKDYNLLQTLRVVDHEVARKLPSLLVCSTLSSCPIGCLVSGYVPVGIFLKVDFESILHCVTWFGSWGMTLCQNAKSCKISIAVKEFRPLFLHHVKHNLVRWWFSGHHLSEWARIWPNFASCLAIL